MKQILYTIALGALLVACVDDKFAGTPLPSGGDGPGEPVSVELSLNTQPAQSPLSLRSKSGSPVFSSTEVCKGIEVSLVEAPVIRAVVENTIRNFWVLQFNGTAGTSTLIRKNFYPNSSSVKTVELTTSSTANRIIVIANEGSEAFQFTSEGTTMAGFLENGFTAGPSGNTGTTGFPLYNNGTDDLVPFAGSTDMIVTGGKQADIMLYRTVAKVTANITVAKKMVDKSYGFWQGQIMHVPAKRFYFPIGQEAVFPQPTEGYVDYEAITVPHGSLTPNADGSMSFSSTAYLPVNLQHPVLYTTPVLRNANAPAEATYFQIMGIIRVGGVISQSVIYQIHLGANFTDDYSISPNYDYTYDITIADENEDDSRVVKFIPGYFGGSLKTYKEDGITEANVDGEKAVWRYEKRIEVYITNVAYTAPGTPPAGTFTGIWGNTAATSNSLWDGRSNTWALNNDNYPAAKTCINLNPETPSSAADLMWYLPACDQALGIYTAGSNTVKAFPESFYWTSSSGGSSVWGILIREGSTWRMVPSSNDCYLRCIRELTPTP